MLRFASRRNVSSGRLLHNPVTLHALTSVVVRISIVSRLVQSIAKELDNGRSCPAEIAMVAKVAGTAFSNDTASDLMQLLGGRGYMENNLAPQLLRDARALSIGEGPNEALTMHIGRSEVQTHRVSQYLREPLAAPRLAETLQATTLDLVARCRSSSRLPDGPARRNGPSRWLVNWRLMHCCWLVWVRAPANRRLRRSPVKHWTNRVCGCRRGLTRRCSGSPRAPLRRPRYSLSMRSRRLSAITRNRLGTWPRALPGKTNRLTRCLSRFSITIEATMPANGLTIILCTQTALTAQSNAELLNRSSTSRPNKSAPNFGPFCDSRFVDAEVGVSTTLF